MYNQTKPGWDFFGEEGSFGTCPALTRVGAFCSEHQSWALKKHWWLWGPRTHGEVKVTTTSWLRDCPEPTPLRLPPMLFPAPPPPRLLTGRQGPASPQLPGPAPPLPACRAHTCSLSCSSWTLGTSFSRRALSPGLPLSQSVQNKTKGSGSCVICAYLKVANAWDQCLSRTQGQRVQAPHSSNRWIGLLPFSEKTVCFLVLRGLGHPQTLSSQGRWQEMGAGATRRTSPIPYSCLGQPFF